MGIIERIPRGVLRAYGARSRRYRTSVGTMHAFVARGRGELPPIVLVHGIGAAATAFTRVFPKLRAHTRRLAAVELPGHGASEAPKRGMSADEFLTGLVELMDAVIEEPSIVVGSSLGGFSAVRYTLRRPEKVRALLLSSPGGAYMDAEPLARFLDVFRIESEADAGKFLERLCLELPWYSPLLRRYVAQQFARPELKQAISLARPEILLRPEELAGLRVPVRVVWGKSDKLLPRENLAFFKAHLPKHAEVIEPEDFSHVPHIERPGKVAKLIVELARSTL
ncbi:MAG: alpha/beta hydrolase [Deltaproteobacteria bacterium]|nr:alpha/beta hydrolase [Deltaproteobacteria bacterium]